jgi:hypothetical protein
MELLVDDCSVQIKYAHMRVLWISKNPFCTILHSIYQRRTQGTFGKIPSFRAFECWTLLYKNNFHHLAIVRAKSNSSACQCQIAGLQPCCTFKGAGSSEDPKNCRARPADTRSSRRFQDQAMPLRASDAGRKPPRQNTAEAWRMVHGAVAAGVRTHPLDSVRIAAHHAHALAARRRSGFLENKCNDFGSE